MIYLEYVLEIESIAKFAVSINYILNFKCLFKI